MGVFEDLGRVIGRAFSTLVLAYIAALNQIAAKIASGRSPQLATYWPEGIFRPAFVAPDDAMSFWKALPKAPIPETIEEVQEASLKDAEKWDKWFKDLLMNLMAMEAIPTVDFGASTVLSAPGVRALAEFVTSLYTAQLEAGRLPMLRRYWTKQYKAMIPPLADILRFTVREVYVPERRKELLSVPTPKEAYEYGELHGLRSKYVDDYWAAHWELPPVGDLIEMLFRKEIDLETFKRYIIYHDYDPTMVDKYTKIIYRLIPRVDLRRAWEANIPGFEDLTPHYEKLHYSPEDAAAEARLQIRVALAAEISDLEREVELSFTHGYSTIDQAGVELDALAFHPLRVKSRIQYYEARAEREHKDALVDIYEDAYVKDLIRTLEELEERLAPLIVRREVLDRILDRAYIKKFKKPKEATK